MHEEWIGRTQRTTDWITASRAAAWHATLDHATDPPRDGDSVPLGFHWALAPAVARESELGADGHARRGGFLPPITLPRRLWAGSRVTFHRPLRVGERVERESAIASIDEKKGRSSPLVFVTVRHRIAGENGLALEEEQDLVFREAPTRTTGSGTSEVESASRPATWRRTIHPSETLLFRFSALTWNTHRIHYDRRYATEVEGYDGLVVHGPLIATLLLELAETQVSPERIARFHFKAKRPTCDTSDFGVFGAPGENAQHIVLWSTDNQGARAVEAEAWLR